MPRIRPASLLIVLAHPDDEIFHGGVLAHLSERGVRVTLACATDGEAGKAHPSVGPVEDQSERPRPIPADVTKASADELRAVWGPFVGEAGTYEVTTGNLITMRPIAAKNPAVMGPGSSITYSYKLDGDTMWVTQQRNQNGPFANPVTVKVVRVE